MPLRRRLALRPLPRCHCSESRVPRGTVERCIAASPLRTERYLRREPARRLLHPRVQQRQSASGLRRPFLKSLLNYRVARSRIGYSETRTSLVVTKQACENSLGLSKWRNPWIRLNSSWWALRIALRVAPFLAGL